MEITWSFIRMLSSLMIAVAAAGCASRYGQAGSYLKPMAQYGVSYV